MFLEKDKYAYPQVLVSISGPNNNSISKQIFQNKERVIFEIKKNELKEKQKRIKISTLDKTDLKSLAFYRA